jgi:hypothetical protein
MNQNTRPDGTEANPSARGTKPESIGTKPSARGTNPSAAGRKPATRKNYGYLLMNSSLVFILPLLSVVGEHRIEHSPVNWDLLGKWFVFWAIGIRLFTAGIKQASNPEFTATNIFRLTTRESYVVIRELGFANISLGVMGILSVINDNWRLIAAISGGIFFGLAALQHFLKKPDSQNEGIAMLYDLIVFFVTLFYLIFQS